LKLLKPLLERLLAIQQAANQPRSLAAAKIS
jgi:hypothetical protein